MEKGNLYIVASPIGNLEDITIRTLKILKEKIDIVYCEDTRQTKKLLNYYDIKAPTQSLHAHSGDIKINGAVKHLDEGKNIAYLTDSGTPGISDPGAKLVRVARLNNIKVIPVPGPSALTSLISVAGFPGKNVVFLGFLSKKDGKKKKEMLKFRDFEGVIVIYESPYRIKTLLNIIHDIFPRSEICIGREMTKIFEEFITGNIEKIINDIDSIKEIGEFAVAIYNYKE